MGEPASDRKPEPDSFQSFLRQIRRLSFEGECVELCRFTDANQIEILAEVGLDAWQEALKNLLRDVGGGRYWIRIRNPETHQFAAQFQRTYSKTTYPGKAPAAAAPGALDPMALLKMHQEAEDRVMTRFTGLAAVLAPIAAALTPILAKAFERPSVTDQLALWNAMGPDARKEKELDLHERLIEMQEKISAAAGGEVPASLAAILEAAKVLFSPSNVKEVMATVREAQRQSPASLTPAKALPAPSPKENKPMLGLIAHLKPITEELVAHGQKGTDPEAVALLVMENVPPKHWPELREYAKKKSTFELLGSLEPRLKLHEQWAQQVLGQLAAKIELAVGPVHANGKSH